MARSGRAGANSRWQRTASRRSASGGRSGMSRVRLVAFALTALLFGACAHTETPSGTAQVKHIPLSHNASSTSSRSVVKPGSMSGACLIASASVP